MKREQGRGFTLIELLIVVAIIAILAAIAVPNFLEAQTRAKISSNKAGMRTVALAVQAYVTDNNVTPPADYLNITRNNYNVWSYNNYTVVSFTNGFPDNGCFYLTTPVAYLTSFGYDVFNQNSKIDAVRAVGYWYTSLNGANRDGVFWSSIGAAATIRDLIGSGTVVVDGQKRGANFMLTATGPDQFFYAQSASAYPPVQGMFFDQSSTRKVVTGEGGPGLVSYDPSNGTVSGGDIIRTE